MVEQVSTDDAPNFEALPFSQGTVHGDTVYTSGQVGIDPGTGEVVEGGIRAETRQTLENVAAVLEAAGSSMDSALEATVFLTDMDGFDAFNDVYAEFVDEPCPARTAVEVSALAGDLAVEIGMVAAVED
ncbi:reactive intermediate/imine deaminase [Halobacteriales archaeon QS_5_70_15]|nr:MAG: reactive intermediate/imine deaminase [Halobacteriales archaeon QS_5_70_15]